MNDAILLAAPIAIGFLIAGLSAINLRSEPWQRALLVGGSIAQVLLAAWLLRETVQRGMIAASMGFWKAPFGIVLVSDTTAALLVVVTALLGVLAVSQELSMIPRSQIRRGHVVFRFLLLSGVSGAFLTGDLFNLYVWFEVLLMASFVLLGLGPSKARAEGATKYVVLNLLSSVSFLGGIGLLYAAYGTLNMAQLHQLASAAPPSPLATAGTIALLSAFAVKAGLFPLFAWLPSSYHLPEPPVAALFAGLLTKVGVYALLRTGTLLAPGHDWLPTTFAVAAALTMSLAVLGAVAQSHMRRILSWHIPSQIGYMAMGLALGTRAALAATVFYIVHHILVKTGLFLAAGSVRLRRDSEDLSDGGGIWKHSPLAALAFLGCALSLAGMPPFSGFWAKIGIVREGLAVESWMLVAVALGTSVLTLYSMVKIWNECYWKDPVVAVPKPARIRCAAVDVPVVALAGTTLLLGVFPGPLWSLAMVAGEQLSDPSLYVRAVLGSVP